MRRYGTNLLQFGLFVYSLVCRVVFHMSGSIRFWFTLVLTVILALLPRFCIKLLKQWFWPSDLHIAREAEILHRISQQEVTNMELREVTQSGSNLTSSPSAV